MLWSRVSSMVEQSSADPKVPGLNLTQSYTKVMDNDKAFHAYRVVHNLGKKKKKRSQSPIKIEQGATTGISLSHLNNRW